MQIQPEIIPEKSVIFLKIVVPNLNCILWEVQV